MKRALVTILSFLALAYCQSPAYAQFSVDWGTSNDTGNSGYTDLNTWFSNNGYSLNAQTDYIGHGAADSDPFFFNPGGATLEIVQQIAGNAPFTGFGFYTGTGFGKSTTGVLAPGTTGPVAINPSQNWGVYMNTPTGWNSTHYRDWFTDRSENLAQQTGGSPTNVGGDPQALIYRLSGNEYLLAWEDLDYSNIAKGQSDRDYNDAYLKVTVTPEPVSAVLFLLGGAVLVGTLLRRRRVQYAR